MNATKRSAARIRWVLCSVFAVAATGCVVHEHTRTVYVPEPQPVVTAPPEPAPQPPPPAQAPVVIIESERDFYEPLEVYGRWEVVGTYGRCWIPGRVEVGWRPYSHGCWQRTDAGWYWASEEPWGWATYHYGRWDFHAHFGWIWVPHTQWAPAWVCWREGGGYVGWAPLRPSVTIGVSIGAVNYEPAYASRAFVFVEHRQMLEPVRPKTVIVNNTTVINKTVNITKVHVVNKTVINEGPRPEVIERASGRKVRPVPVHEVRRKEETTVAARERNIPTDTARKVQPPVRSESQTVRPPADAPRDIQVVEKAPVADHSHEVVTRPPRPSATHPQPLPDRIETEKPTHKEKKHDWKTARNVIPPTIEPEVKPEVKLERPVPPGPNFHSAENRTVAAKPTSQPVATDPVLDETRRNTPADKRATAAPPSSEPVSRNDVASETTREAGQPAKTEAKPPAEDRTPRPQVSPKEKARGTERAQANKRTKEAREPKNNKGEEQDSTTPPPGSPRQPR